MALPDRPRTRHLRPDGTPRFTNRLKDETSPYLLQHVHNPVDWWPWSDAAFAEARRRDVPVFLSVGYATCHWCHVMEEESFEDEDIAAILNAHYVCIKVDREERPDIDALYMTAVQALTGHGGWPMSVFLTPEDKKPFFAGTYFPARDGDRGARTGFRTVLLRLHQVWRDERDAIQESARRITEELQVAWRAPRPADVKGADAVLDDVASFVASRFDERHGGLRPAPKFPSTTPLRLLLRHGVRDPGPRGAESRRRALFTLRKIIDGGIHDQLGGGFHRYSVDEQWLVPHFEKMLYDNALLVPALVEAWQVTGEQRFKDVALATLRWMDDEMSVVDADGRRTGFRSATDADSFAPSGGREEGFFFTWTPAELRTELAGHLSPAEIDVVAAVYDITDAGNFEHGRSIPWHRRPVAEIARSLGRSVEDVDALVARARPLLLRARRERPAPLTDDKALAAWNGLAVSAFARAAFAFDDDDLAARARAALTFVLETMRRPDGKLWRTWRRGVAKNDGVLDDHAFVCRACLDVFELDGDPRWLRAARALDDVIARFFADDEHGGFFSTAKDGEPLLTREKPDRDGAEPCGNSVHADNLVRLALLCDDDDARRRADRTFRAFGQILSAHAHALAEMALALDLEEHGREIVIVRPPGDIDDDGRQLLRVLRSRFLPARVVAWGDGRAAVDDVTALPLLRGRVAVDGKVTVYVCEQGSCRLPVTTSRALLEQLGG